MSEDLVRSTIEEQQRYVQSKLDRLDSTQNELEHEITSVLAEKAELSVEWGIYEEFLATYKDRRP